MSFLFRAVLFLSPLVSAVGSGDFHANEYFISHSSFKTAEPKIEADSILIPLKRIGKLFFVDAQVDGQSGNFLLDLGAVNLVLNKTYFRNSYSDQRSSSGGVSGSELGSEKTMIQSLNIQGLSFSDLEAEVFNLGNIENKTGIKILGLLGSNLFKTVEIVIDTRKLQLKIFPLNKAGRSARRVEKNEIQIPFRTVNNVLLVNGEVSGKKLLFSFDTGAEVNVLDKQNHPKVLESVIIRKRVLLRGLGGEPTEVLVGNLPELEIGSSVFKDMNTIIADLSSMSANYGIRIDGMLGYDFFSKGVLVINMETKVMAINLYKK